MTEQFSKGVKHTPTSKFPLGYNYLSDKEKKYFKIMNSASGVLYIYSAPGFAKSAILRNIAKKIGYQYFDVRLSMVDETDVGLFPMVDEITINGKPQKMLRHIAPEWAYKANTQPTIIHFEELNRSSSAVRNAALQILLEREIGTFFKFNDDVLMCASGNLGEDDGTDVEEFDMALNNRLVHIEHTLTFTEWYENYADEFVCPAITGFLRNHQDYYWRKADDKIKNKAYATPRSWTFLSDYIWKNFGNNQYITRLDSKGKPIIDMETGKPKLYRQFPPTITWLQDIKEIGSGFIGASNIRFFKYCEDTLKITLENVLNDFDAIENEIKKFNRDKKSDLLQSMKERKVALLNDRQIENLVKFLETISDDECVGYITHVLDTEYSFNTVETEENRISEKFLANPILDRFREIIAGYVDDDEPAPLMKK